MLGLEFKANVPEMMRQALRYDHGIDGDHLEIGSIRKAMLSYVRSDYLDRLYEGLDGAVWNVTTKPG